MLLDISDFKLADRMQIKTEYKKIMAKNGSPRVIDFKERYKKLSIVDTLAAFVFGIFGGFFVGGVLGGMIAFLVPALAPIVFVFGLVSTPFVLVHKQKKLYKRIYSLFNGCDDVELVALR